MSSTCALSCTFLESVTSRSPHEDDPPSSEGSNGESDYGNSRDEAMKKRVLLRNRGRPVSDTEDEDRLAEDEMNAEVVAESDGRHRAGARRQVPSAKKKGKQHATDQIDSDGDGWNDDGVDNDDDQMDEDCDDNNTDDDGDGDSHTRYISGPLSEEAQEEVRQLGEETKARADDLARKYRKSPNTIMHMAGLGVQNARQHENMANKHRIWYSHHHPRPKTSQ